MAVKTTYDEDNVRKRFIGKSTDTKPTSSVATFGDFFYCTDERRSYIYSSTGGWVLHQSFYST